MRQHINQHTSHAYCASGRGMEHFFTPFSSGELTPTPVPSLTGASGGAVFAHRAMPQGCPATPSFLRFPAVKTSPAVHSRRVLSDAAVLGFLFASLIQLASLLCPRAVAGPLSLEG